MSLLSLVSSMSSLVGTIGPKFVSIGKSAIQAFKDIGQFFHDKLIQPIKDAVDGLGGKLDGIQRDGWWCFHQHW